MNKKRSGGGGRKQGIGSTLIGFFWLLVMIGVVLAAFQLTSTRTVSESIQLARDKAVEYSECIPSGECGILSIIEGIKLPGGSGSLIGDGGSDKPGSQVEPEVPGGFGDPSAGIVLPEKPGVEIKPEELSISRETKGYRGPEKGEPYVNKAGVVTKSSSSTMLDTLKIVKDKEDKDKDVGYARSEWKHWTGTADRPCWNTREEILKRDAVPGTIKYVDKKKKATENYEEACAVGTPLEEKGRIKIDTKDSGVWIGPYNGKKITSSSDVDIDHVIALSNAARNGGQDWTSEQKEAFANDPDNLLATSAKENRTKGDKGPGKYMPPLKTYQCQYAKTYTTLSYKYDLTITESDKKALTKALETCKD